MEFSSSSQPVDQIKVLVAEDDAILLNALEHCLVQAGYKVVTATDGMKALEIYNIDKNFDLVITDIMMPHISGLTLLNYIKQNTDKYTPVILISSLDKAKTISSMLDLKADEVLIKPIDFTELVKSIKQLRNVIS